MLIAEIGGRCHEVLEDGQALPDGYIEMTEGNPSSNYIACKDGRWVLSYKKEQAFHLRRLAYSARLDPLVSEYTTKIILGEQREADQMQQVIRQIRQDIQAEYPYA